MRGRSLRSCAPNSHQLIRIGSALRPFAPTAVSTCYLPSRRALRSVISRSARMLAQRRRNRVGVNTRYECDSRSRLRELCTLSTLSGLNARAYGSGRHHTKSGGHIVEDAIARRSSRSLRTYQQEAAWEQRGRPRRQQRQRRTLDRRARVRDVGRQGREDPARPLRHARPIGLDERRVSRRHEVDDRDRRARHVPGSQASTACRSASSTSACPTRAAAIRARRPTTRRLTSRSRRCPASRARSSARWARTRRTTGTPTSAALQGAVDHAKAWKHGAPERRGRRRVRDRRRSERVRHETCRHRRDRGRGAAPARRRS